MPVRTLLALAVGLAAVAQAPNVVRRARLTAEFTQPKAVDRIEVKEVSMPAHLASGAHRHPCPVVGTVASGTIVFQIRGRKPQTLKTGDAFFEPANAVVERFDAQDRPVRFVAFYLLGKGETRLVEPVGEAPRAGL